ncbi:hypothetical protein GUI12_00710 [Anaplasmataceae bacterium AB001_6]|nr:hypothetical protein GUI12_00710 [Anaplasmataceae bacterium AB001_6]
MSKSEFSGKIVKIFIILVCLLLLFLSGLFFYLESAFKGFLSSYNNVIYAGDNNNQLDLKLDFTDQNTKAASFFKDNRTFLFFNCNVPEAKHGGIEDIITKFGIQDVVVESIKSGFLVSFEGTQEFGLSWKANKWHIIREEAALNSMDAIPHDDGYTVYFGNLDHPTAYKIEDSEQIGSTYVVPVKSSSRAFSVSSEYKYIFADVLPSSLGITITSKVDNLHINSGNSNISFTLSKEINEHIYGGNKYADNNSVIKTALFDFESWRQNDTSGFYEKESDLLERIIILDGYSKYKASTDLFKFYVAHGLFRQANNYGIYLKAKYPDMTMADLHFNVIYFANLFLDKQYDEASEGFKDIDRSLLSEEQREEVNLWQSFSDMLSSDPKGKEYFDFNRDYTRTILSNYTFAENFFIPLLAVIADSSKLNIQVLNLQQFLRSQKNLTLIQRNKILWAISKILQNTNEISQAQEIWSYLANSDYDGENRANGILMLMQNATVQDIDRYVKEFDLFSVENMQFMWRNQDNLEGNILNFLSQYFYEERDYYKSLKYANNIISKILGYSNIVDVFNLVDHIFLSLSEDTFLSDITKIKIFLAFNDIIPVKSSSINIIRSFIDSLQKLDMDNYIVELQDELLNMNVSDFLRRQSILYLQPTFEKRSDYAKLLDIIARYPFLDSDIDFIYLKTRIYLNLKDYDRAWEMIKNYNTDTAIVLKARALWENEMFDEYVDYLESYWEFREYPYEELDEGQQKTVLRLAFLYLKKDSLSEIQKLYEGFSHLFNIRDLKDSFDKIYKLSQSFGNTESYANSLRDLIKTDYKNLL